MADLYGTNTRSSSLGSEDTSSILQDLLNNSIIPPPSSSDKHSSPPRPTAAVATSSSGSDLFRRFPDFSYSECRFREGNSTAGSTSFNFSDLGLGFIADAEKCNTNGFSSVCGVDSDGITSSLEKKSPAENEFGFDLKKGIEGSEAMMVNPDPPRSSKRSRAAEFHNLSEKRRRSRINEKLKALQNLIPNSNKTDKASMLDEAIEYLKQLQLQVQMLSMRNGLSLQPFCLLGSLHPAQLPQSGIGFDEGNELFDTKGGEDTYSGNQEMSMRAAFHLPNQSAPSNQPNLITPMTNISNAETSFGLEPSPQNHYGSFSHLTSSNVTY